MGNCFRPFRRQRQPQKCVTLAILGVDDAGKTTASNSFSGEAVDQGVVPTVGFRNVQFSFEQYDITLYDLGGGKNIRPVWKQYLPEVHGFVYVVDASSSDRMEEARETFRDTLEHPHVFGKPILLLANKQDKPDALDEVDLCEELNLESAVNMNKCPCRIDPCTAIRGTGKKMDSRMREGLRWLLTTVDSQWADLHGRVQTDTKAVQEVRLAEDLARRERVRRLREERERQEEEERRRLGIVDKDPEEAEEGEQLDGDPFKPLDMEQLQEKEKALKAEKKRRQDLEASWKDQATHEDSVAPSHQFSHSDIIDDNKDSISRPRPSVPLDTPFLANGKQSKKKHRRVPRSGEGLQDSKENDNIEDEDIINGSPRSPRKPSHWKSTTALSDIPVSSNDLQWSERSGPALGLAEGSEEGVSPRVRKVKKRRLRDLGAKLRSRQTAAAGEPGEQPDISHHYLGPPPSVGELDRGDLPDDATGSRLLMTTERKKPLLVNGHRGPSGQGKYELSSGFAVSGDAVHDTLTHDPFGGAKLPRHTRQQGAMSLQPDRLDNRTWGMADDLPPVDGDSYTTRSQPNFHHHDDFLL